MFEPHLKRHANTFQPKSMSGQFINYVPIKKPDPMTFEKPKHNILVISSTYPRHQDDYAVPWMRETHRRLVEQGHQVTVLAPSFKGLKTHFLDGIEVVRFRYAPKAIESLTHEEGASYKVRNPWKQVLAIPYVIMGCLFAAWLAMTRSYTAIHVHWPFPHGIMGQVAAVINRSPLVVMSHGAELTLAQRKPWIRPFLKQSLRAANLRIANSSDTADKVRELSGGHCVVLPYGTTVESLACPINPDQPARVLFTGRLIERKGLEYLLQAAPKILEQHNAEFIITGDGDQRAKLEALRDKLGLRKSVNFVGFLSKTELQDEYASCNVWVNPGIVDSWGDAEGLGVGSIEAYNFNKPVVASAVGGIPDTVIDGETGYLVPQKDVAALAEAICRLLSDPEKARLFGRNGNRFARKTFSWDRIIARLESLYGIASAAFPRSSSQTAV